MLLRRAIAAFVTLAFTALLCAPAFAAVVSADDADDCCCSKKAESKQPTAKTQDCGCPACACTIGDATPFTPLHVVASDAPTSVVAIALRHPRVTSLDVTPLTREPAAHAARGPPPGAQPPLYILYDTLLI